MLDYIDVFNVHMDTVLCCAAALIAYSSFWPFLVKAKSTDADESSSTAQGHIRLWMALLSAPVASMRGNGTHLTHNLMASEHVIVPKKMMMSRSESSIIRLTDSIRQRRTFAWRCAKASPYQNESILLNLLHIIIVVIFVTISPSSYVSSVGCAACLSHC